MEIVDVLTIIYYILEIATILYTCYVCIKATLPSHRVEEATQVPDIEAQQQESQEVHEAEDNILMYIASTWLSSNPD